MVENNGDNVIKAIYIAKITPAGLMDPCNTCPKDPKTCDKQGYEPQVGVICDQYRVPIRLLEKGPIETPIAEMNSNS